MQKAVSTSCVGSPYGGNEYGTLRDGKVVWRYKIQGGNGLGGNGLRGPEM